MGWCNLGQLLSAATSRSTLPQYGPEKGRVNTEFVGYTFDLNETKHVVWTVGVTGQVVTTTVPAVACVVSFSSRLSVSLACTVCTVKRRRLQ